MQALGVAGGLVAGQRAIQKTPMMQTRAAQTPYATPARSPEAVTAIPLLDALSYQEPPFASGGRIGRATGGRVDPQIHAQRLILAAERAKKEASGQTEALLEQPDEHIVKALDIAKRHI
jgi:hypothetical protein